MYGTPPAPYPQRIVCLTAETTEIVFALGAGARVVGVSGAATRPPEAREKPRVGGFTTFRLDRILALEPDLVLAFSDLQAEVVRDLVRAGTPVLALNQRSLAGVFQAILLIGGVLGREAAARGLVADMEDEIRQVREFSSVWPDRPRVYFEEWGDPLIAGIRWVSELIEIAGGEDVFPELRDRPDARGRVVDPAEVVRRDPQIIVASWCGKRVDVEAIRRRPGWEVTAAVRDGRVCAIPSEDVLVPGPSLLHGLQRLHDIVQAWVAGEPFAGPAGRTSSPEGDQEA
ncbi:MAG TPA: cobalamin-binding protein [Methylomirabilota bacterium]|nr:cobalamin-binding protein [Methylomirabilota bacterium]